VPVSDAYADVDEARQVLTDEGLRPLRVWTVLRTWSGVEPGDGSSSDQETELTPRPKVHPPGSPALKRFASEAGLDMRGQVLVEQLSPNLSLEDLVGPTLTDAQQWFFRVAHDTGEAFGRTGLFRLAGQPFKRPLDWVLRLQPSEAPA